MTQASNFGEQKQVNDFFNVSVNTRFGSASWSAAAWIPGVPSAHSCFNVDSPPARWPPILSRSRVGAAYSPVTPSTATTINGQGICQFVNPFKGQTQLKAFGSYPFPHDVTVSLIVQNISGPAVTASYAAPNALIAPSLHRNLAACGTRVVCTNTAAVPLIVPGTQFEDRYTRLDMRLSKRFQLSQRVRLTGNFNVYNLLNGSAIQVENTNYGPLWLQPSLVDGRRNCVRRKPDLLKNVHRRACGERPSVGGWIWNSSMDSLPSHVLWRS